MTIFNNSLDTETCGYHGPIVLIQYAIDEGEVNLYEPWCNPVFETLKLIEKFCEHNIIGFNLAFDWFHIQKLYNCLYLLQKKKGNIQPRDYIDDYADVEPEARDGYCVKPAGCLDLLLYARKGPYQVSMDRKPIVVRKVPNVIAEVVANELDKRIDFPEYLFAKRKRKDDIWKIFPSRDAGFSDIVCRFSASAALKILCFDAGIRDPKERLLYQDVTIEPRPIELAWAPYAKALSSKEKYWFAKIGSKQGVAWPGCIKKFIDTWRFDEDARKYAADDVLDTRDLYKHFDCPDINDTDSILAGMVGSIRWKGYPVDDKQIEDLDAIEIKRVKDIPTAPAKVMQYVAEIMSEAEIELSGINKSSKKVILESIDNERSREVLLARQAQYKRNLFHKLLVTKRLHPAISVIGSLSSRTSGRTETKDTGSEAGLNALGIPHDKNIRKAFTMNHEGMILLGGDFDAYEVSIEAAVVNDSNLEKDLLTCYTCKQPFDIDLDICPNCKTKTRQKLHALFGESLFPGKTYQEIVDSDGTSFDMYTMAKSGLFGSILYGGDENTLEKRLGIDLEDGKKARETFFERYKGIGEQQKIIYDQFCSMRQPDGIGGRVFWNEPAEYIESLLGFRRYFHLENEVAKIIFELANDPPKGWEQFNQKVFRKDRTQKAHNAVRSALFACAFGIQSVVMRAALNHVIQSTGAGIVKELQRKLWEHQPVGVHEWHVIPMNIHDEIVCPTKKELKEVIIQTVKDFVIEYRKIVPLLKIGFKEMKNWGEK